MIPNYARPIGTAEAKPVSRAQEKRKRTRDKETHWQKVRRQVQQRDHYKCRACGSTEYAEVHHLKPRSLGREDATQNCLLLCRQHHADRHAYRLFIAGNDANKTLRFEFAPSRRLLRMTR